MRLFEEFFDDLEDDLIQDENNTLEDNNVFLFKLDIEFSAYLFNKFGLRNKLEDFDVNEYDTKRYLTTIVNLYNRLISFGDHIRMIDSYEVFIDEMSFIKG